MELVGANRRARVTAEERSDTRTNYFIGKDSTRWRTDVPTFSRVKVEKVYTGIDIVYYGSGQQVEYDFKVAPGADLKAILLRFTAARSVRLDEAGGLMIETPAGMLLHRKPLAYQNIDGSRREVAAQYRLTDYNDVTFTVGEYDKAKPLIIDPVLSYATYFGSRTGGEVIKAVAFDSAGNAYVIGNAASSSLPTTPGAVQATNHGRATFVAKLNAEGTALVYCTYLGGTNGEVAAGIAVDGAGNAYVTGTTYSRDFPTTANAFQRSRGDYYHSFVSKLNPTGTALLYSTYLGGKDETAAGTGIAVDPTGQATITGWTNSRRFPTTTNAPQPKNAGDFEAFVSRLTSDGSGLVYSTYLGGSGTDMSRAIAVDPEGSAYIAGDTYSKDFPTTPGAFKRDADGSDTSFVAKISSTGDRFIYSTYVAPFSIANGVAVDAAGHAYVTGYVIGATFPTTLGALQPASGGGFDAFVIKLNSDGSGLFYSTFLGGSGTDTGNAIAVDSIGQAYVTGSTNSVDFPLAQPLQSQKRGGPLFKTTDSGASWSDIPAISASINSLVVDPHSSSTVYGSTSDSVIKSTDGGASFRVLATGLGPIGYYSVIVIDPTNSADLYLMGQSSVFKSGDAGLNWQRIDIPITSLYGLSSLIIDPKSGDTLYVGARQVAVPGSSDQSAADFVPPDVMFKSTDRGATWAPIRFPLSTFGIATLAVDPRTPSTLYAATDTFNVGLLKSTDSGATWFKPNGNGATLFDRLAIDPANTNVIYGSTFSGVLRSTDGGASFSQASPQGLSLTKVAIDPHLPSTLYAISFNGVHRSTDIGASWIKILDTRYGKEAIFDPGQASVVYVPATITDDMFVARLNETGTALGYLTYIGGFDPDYGQGIAADPYGNVCAAGFSYSTNFPVTPGAYQLQGASVDTSGILIRISDPIALRVTGVAIKGKKLLVSGQGFHSGAVIVLHGSDLETQNDATTPATLLISKRGGKQIAPGQTVTIRVRDADGKLSDAFSFTRE
jgi:hypothetical protein